MKYEYVSVCEVYIHLLVESLGNKLYKYLQR